MGHNIGERDIQVGIETAWHGLTTIVPEINADNCGILYEMDLQQLFLPDGTPTDNYAIVSKDDGKAIGKAVSQRYALISNQEIWKAVNEALAHTDHQIVSVGTVGNRSRGFISVKLDNAFEAAGRNTESTLNILWGHGGNMNVVARSGFTVVVCQNTFNMAMSEHGDFQFAVRHLGDTETNMLNMNQAIEAHYATVDAFAKSMNEMNQKMISETDAQKFFAGFIVEDEKEKISTQKKNQYTKLTKLFKDGKGNNGETFADIFNAATDYYTHFNAGGEDNASRQFESSEFGRGLDKKIEVYKLLNEERVDRVGTMFECVTRGEKVLEKVA